MISSHPSRKFTWRNDMDSGINGKLTYLLVALLVVGSCGYAIIEGWPLVDSVFMTVITLSTVGYGETQELSVVGRFFTTILIAVAVVLMACWTAGITSAIVTDDLSGALRKRKELKMISQLFDHTVVCGGGVFAQTVIEQLIRQQKDVVVIVKDPDRVARIKRLFPGVPVVEDDPTSELALFDSNAISAKNLIAAADSDFDNLLITITGKGLGNEMTVICCAQTGELASRMMKVGADEVICPFVLGGESAVKFVA